MSEQLEMTRAHTGEEVVREVMDSIPTAVETAAGPEKETVQPASPEPTQPEGWHAQAGRKGARRVHQLIEHGRLYEQEHGLKRGRQRLRQLIQLGKLYEQE